jgi:thymidylate synthase
VLGREPGEFIHTFGDLHLYENHKEQAREQISREPNAFPKIEFTQEFASLDEFRPEFVKLVDYEPHAAIRGELTAAGGYNKKLHG